MAVLLVLGAVFARYNKDLSDFVRGGARGTWWMVGTSIFMAGVSAFTFTGNASAAYEAGYSFAVIYLANIAGFAVGGFCLGPWLRQTRAYTGVDVVRARFGTGVEQLSAGIGVLLAPISAALQLYALAVFTSTTLNLPLVPVLIAIGTVVIFYSTTGGKWAVMATDFVQATVLLSITILVFILSLKAIGGVGEFVHLYNSPAFHNDYKFFKQPGEFPGDRFTVKWAIMAFLMQINAQISLQAATRYIAAKDGREASRSAWLGVFLMAIGSLIWFVPPIVARFLYADELMATGLEKPTESAYAFIAMKLLPNGMVGMLIAAMFAATMSSMDTGLNTQVGVVARNIIPRIRSALGYHHDLKPRTEVRICHIATLFFGALIIAYALMFASQDTIALFDAYLLIASIIGIPMGIPHLVGLWIKNLPKWSYFPILTGCLIPSVWSFIDQSINGTTWTIQERAMWIFIFGMVATAICWLLRNWSSAKSREDIKDFFKTMTTPVDYEKEIGASEVDYEQYFVMSKAVGVVSLLMLGIVLFPNTLFHRLCILMVAASILLVAGLLRFQGHRTKRKYLARQPEEAEAKEYLPESELSKERV
ncbi:MAG: hypothetical protein Q7Q73_10125 [Verrucomicrobiota bacterium JB024]|nr:hypothetical protein [Verrucomicrobiota bacterium JB024]